MVDLGKVLETGLVGSTPLVDRLPRITYYENAGVSAYELDQLLLCPVYILVFIYKKILDVLECAWFFFKVLDC